MKKTRSVFSLLLALVLVLLVALPASAEDDLASMEPITFTYFILNSSFLPPDADAPTVQNIYDNTKVTIDFIVPPADGESKLNMMLAADDVMPDIIEINNGPILSKLIEAGKLLPLEDLIEQYAPTLVANYGDKIGTLKDKDGHIYQLPGGYKINGIEMFPEASSGFVVHTDYLEQNNWYQPKTFDDFYNLIKKYRDEGGEMIPLTMALGEPSTIEVLLDIANASYGGTAFGNMNLVDGKVVYARTNPQNKELFRLLNKMYNEGLLDPESLVQKRDMLVSKLSAGQALATISGYSEPYDANQVLEHDGATGKLYTFFLKQDNTVDATTYARYTGALISGSSFGISSDCQDPVRMIRFIDWLNTEEGFMAINGKYDFEGKNDGSPDYDWYIDVKKKLPTSVNGNEVYATDWMSEELAINPRFTEERGLWKFSNLTYIGCNAIDYKYDWIAMELDTSVWWSELDRKIFTGFGKTGLEYFPDHRLMANDITDISGLMVAADSDAASIYARCNDYYNKQVVKCIAAPVEEFDAMYDEMISQIENIGIGEWEEAINAEYDARQAMWYGEN